MCKWKSRSNFDIFFQSYGIFLKAYLFRDIDNRKQNQETFGKKKLFLIALVFVNIFRGVHLEKYLSFRRSNYTTSKISNICNPSFKVFEGTGMGKNTIHTESWMVWSRPWWAGVGLLPSFDSNTVFAWNQEKNLIATE